MSYPETLSHVLAKLEPDSGFDGCAHDPAYTPATRALVSLAISARRIADRLEAITPELADGGHFMDARDGGIA